MNDQNPKEIKDLWHSVKDKVRQFKQNPMGAILNAEY